MVLIQSGGGIELISLGAARDLHQRDQRCGEWRVGGKGDFSALADPLIDPFNGKPFLNNQIPKGRIHPVASRLLSVIPDPNRSDPFRNFVNGLPSVQNTDTFTGRVDYEFSEDSKLFANYSLRNSHEIEVNSLPIFGATTKGREQEVSIEYNHDFNEGKVA